MQGCTHKGGGKPAGDTWRGGGGLELGSEWGQDEGKCGAPVGGCHASSMARNWGKHHVGLGQGRWGPRVPSRGNKGGCQP